MKRTTLFVAVLLACSGSALAQEKKPEPKPAQPTAQPAAKPAQPAVKPADKAPAGQPSQDEMMKMWEEMGKTGENHKLLHKAVGSWSAQCKSWMAPGAPPEESTGTSVVTSEMGGRFTKVAFSGSMMGQPFTGLGYYGYNNATKKFESTWMDSMMTGIMFSTGSYDAAKKTLTWTGKMMDPMDNQEKPFRIVEKFVDDNNTVMEMYCPGPDGKEMKNMEITYVRTGGVKPAPAPAPAKK